MKPREKKIIEWFLQLAIGAGFLSAVADRFGLWGKEHSAWGNWSNFVAYTQTINPWLPPAMVTVAAIVATALEIVLGIALIINFKVRLAAKASGVLLLLFALAMTFSKSIKAPLDYSVFSAAAAAFALSMLKRRS